MLNASDTILLTEPDCSLIPFINSDSLPNIFFNSDISALFNLSVSTESLPLSSTVIPTAASASLLSVTSLSSLVL